MHDYGLTVFAFKTGQRFIYSLSIEHIEYSNISNIDISRVCKNVKIFIAQVYKKYKNTLRINMIKICLRKSTCIKFNAKSNMDIS